MEATKLITKILLITIFYKLETYKGDPDAYMQMVHPWFLLLNKLQKKEQQQGNFGLPCIIYE